MSLFGRKKKVQNGDTGVRTKDFFDCILPGTMKFFANYYIVGDTYRCVWVIREYPPTTEEQAILAQLADRTGVTLRLYHRRVTPVEEKQIVNNAARKTGSWREITTSPRPWRQREICRMCRHFSLPCATTGKFCFIAVCTWS